MTTERHDDRIILVDQPLAPEPLTEREMGARVPQAIDDHDIRGSRFLLTMCPVQPVSIDGYAGGVVRLSLSLTPAPRVRFISADLAVRITMPEEARIAGIAPTVVEDDQAIRVEVENEGKLAVRLCELSGSGKRTKKQEFQRYHCRVQGSGVGAKLARWVFEEDSTVDDGIVREQILVFTLPVVGLVKADVVFSSELIGRGTKRVTSAIRNAILGPETRRARIKFKITDGEQRTPPFDVIP